MDADEFANTLAGEKLASYQELKVMGYSAIDCKLGLETKDWDLAGAVD